MGTQAEFDKMLRYFKTSAREDFADTVYTSASPFSISANTWTDLPNNKGSVTDSNLPSDIAEIYDAASGKVYLTDEVDAPNYVWSPTFTFDPSSSSGEIIEFRIMIDSPTPVYVGPDTKPVKGAVDDYTLILTPYIGGFVKLYGMKAQVRSSVAGDIYDITTKIYRT